jgi:hypothetical protein
MQKVEKGLEKISNPFNLHVKCVNHFEKSFYAIIQQRESPFEISLSLSIQAAA